MWRVNPYPLAYGVFVAERKVAHIPRSTVRPSVATSLVLLGRGPSRPWTSRRGGGGRGGGNLGGHVSVGAGQGRVLFNMYSSNGVDEFPRL